MTVKAGSPSGDLTGLEPEHRLSGTPLKPEGPAATAGMLTSTLLTAAAFGCGGSSPAAPAPTGDTLSPLIPAEGYVRLAFNESPFGPPPCIAAALDEMLGRDFAMSAADPDFLPGINRYPDFLNVTATQSVATRHGMSPGYVIVCCGISELLYMCSQAFLRPGTHLLLPELSYLLPTHYARRHGNQVRTAPMDGQHRVDLQALLERVDEATGLIYLANPNNPAGSILSLQEIETFVGLVASRSPEAAVLIDEAYMDYVLESPPPEAQSLVQRFPVVVGRTLSKAFGLAGLRAGYALGNPDLVLTLNGFLSGYLGGDPGWRMFEGNVNRMAVAALQACLSEEGLGFVDSVRSQNAALRDRLATGLQARGFQPLPSHASFLMVHVKADGENLRRYLCSRKILVQAGASFHPDYDEWVRVSVGTEEEIQGLLDALEGYDPSRSYPASFPVFYHGI